MSFKEITLEYQGPLARLILNQPDKANALSQAMIAELSLALREIAASEARAVILSGAGKHFCAGHKMEEMVDRDPALYLDPVSSSERHLFTQLLFSYKLNPQTVLFLGYSDNHFGERGLDLTRTDRTLFLKIGYAFLM